MKKNLNKKFAFVYVTCPTKIAAKKIAAQLVRRKLCACANISGPINSIYRWQGHIHSDREYVLLLKSELKIFSQIEKAIKKIHPYKTPCIVALPIVCGSKDYLDWLLG